MQDANSMVVNQRNANEADEVPVTEHLNNIAVQLAPFTNPIEERTRETRFSLLFAIVRQFQSTCKTKILRARPFFGSPSGSTTRTSTDSPISCATTASASSSTTTRKCSSTRLGSELQLSRYRRCLHSPPLALNFRQVQYTDAAHCEAYYKMDEYPPTLEKKIVLLKYFRSCKSFAGAISRSNWHVALQT